jgi:hypothetical protein
MKKTSTCYLPLSSQNDFVSLSWLTTECIGHQYACLRLQLVLTLKQRTILSAHFNCRCFLVLIIKTDCFLNITDRIIFIIEVNLVSKYLLMMCALFVSNYSLLIEFLFGCWRKLSLAICSKNILNPLKFSCYAVAYIPPGLTLKSLKFCSHRVFTWFAWISE